MPERQKFPVHDWQKRLFALIRLRYGNIGAFVKEERLDRGAVERYLLTDDPDPALSTLRGIAKALKLSIAEVLPDADRTGESLPVLSDPEIAALKVARTLTPAELTYWLGQARGLTAIRSGTRKGRQGGRAR